MGGSHGRKTRSEIAISLIHRTLISSRRACQADYAREAGSCNPSSICGISQASFQDCTFKSTLAAYRLISLRLTIIVITLRHVGSHSRDRPLHAEKTISESQRCISSVVDRKRTMAYRCDYGWVCFSLATTRIAIDTRPPGSTNARHEKRSLPIK